MYSLVLSSLAAVAAAVFFRYPEVNRANVFWTVVWSLLAFLAAFAAVNWAIRRRLMRVMEGIQLMLSEGQKSIQKQINDWQHRPSGDPNRFLARVQKQQEDLLHAAIAETSALEPFRNWVPFFGRQINTTRMQFHYQLKEFGKVDELLPKCLVIDPLTASMKIARQYLNKAPLEEIEK